MTTPTKEDIEHIGKNMPTWGCEFGGECVPAPEVIEKIVTEWENIKGDEVLSWLEKEYEYAKERHLNSRKETNTETEEKLMFALQCLISMRKNQK